MTVLLSAAVIFAMYMNSPYKERTEAVQIKCIRPEVSDIYDVCTVRGTIVEQGRQNLYADSAALVEEIYVSLGEYVREGQPIMRMRPADDRNEASRAAFSEMERRIDELMENSADAEEAESLRDELLSVMAEVVDMQENTVGKSAEPYTLHSPADGIVMSLAEAGSRVLSFIPCAAISDMSKLALRADVSEEDAASICEGMRCTVSVKAFDASLGGEVKTVMPYARQSGLFTAAQEVKTRVVIDLIGAESAGIRPGYSAQARLTANYRPACLLLPYEALGQDGRGEYVMKISGGRVQKTYVETGAELDEQVQICSGISERDLLAASVEDIEEGQMILIK
ncbi:MAG: efflux RND transporter periplasmic adaptor subunit [Clostridia bacterium]|nr:efflux RND transporter periplasmic adaptor subunit [Clostridia bacterium]